MYKVTYNNELAHYGVKGMKWGKKIFGDWDDKDGYKPGSTYSGKFGYGSYKSGRTISMDSSRPYSGSYGERIRMPRSQTAERVTVYRATSKDSNSSTRQRLSVRGGSSGKWRDDEAIARKKVESANRANAQRDKTEKANEAKARSKERNSNRQQSMAKYSTYSMIGGRNQQSLNWQREQSRGAPESENLQTYVSTKKKSAGGLSAAAAAISSTAKKGAKWLSKYFS